MTHRTYRSLDRPPKLIGFTIAQWGALIAGAATLLALVHVTGMPAKAAITIGVFALGLPAALTYVSEAGGLQIGRLLCDAARWRLACKTLHATTAADSGQAPIAIAAERQRASRAATRGGEDAS